MQFRVLACNLRAEIGHALDAALNVSRDAVYLPAILLSEYFWATGAETLRYLLMLRRALVGKVAHLAFMSLFQNIQVIQDRLSLFGQKSVRIQ